MHAAGIHRRGRDVPKDSWFLGTGITPPIAMMTVQAVATTVLARRPSNAAALTLGMLGATMVCGYAIEAEARAALTPRSWDTPVTPLTAAGIALPLPMVGLGLRRRPGRTA